MQEIINLIVNNGIGVVCVSYMIYFQTTTMNKMLTTLTLMNERLEKIESNIKK